MRVLKVCSTRLDMTACGITLGKLLQVEIIESGKDRRTLLRLWRDWGCVNL